MPVIDYFSAAVALDQNGSLVRDAVADVYALSDTTFSIPLAITDLQGVPMAKLRSNSEGIFPPFRIVSGEQQIVAKSGDRLTPMTSIGPIAVAAEAAAAAAVSAATSVGGAAETAASARDQAVAAAAAAQAVGNSNDTIVAGLLNNPASATSIKVTNTIASEVTTTTRIACTMPAGFSWHSDYSMVDPHLTFSPDGTAVGDIDISATALFDAFSTARSAPTNTYYLDAVSGNDSNDGLTAGTALKSFLAVRNKINALLSTAKCKVRVKGGLYGIGLTWSGDTATAVGVNRETAWIAYDGAVVVGAFLMDFSGIAADLTHTNTFSMTDPAHPVTRVVDLWSGGSEYVLAASAAVCNATPGTWCIEGGKTYIHPVNGLIPTAKTTRIFLQRPAAYARTQTHLFFGSEDGSPWSIQGGNAGGSWSGGGAFWADMLTPPSTRNVLIFDGVSFDYSGAQGTTSNAVTIQRWNGLVAFFDCSSRGAAKDAIGVANDVYTPDSSSAAGTYILTVNWNADDPGRGNNVSCNSQTAHSSGVHWIDIASKNSRGKGGTIRHVDNSQAWIIGARVFADRGDTHTTTGVTPPTAVRADDNADIWLDRCIIEQDAGGYALYAGSAGAGVHHRDCIIRGRKGGPGTVDTYTVA